MAKIAASGRLGQLEDANAEAGTPTVQLMGSGAILREVREAAALLKADFGIAADVFSVTSFSELARDAREVERFNRLHPDAEPRQSHLASQLVSKVPVVAATDYVRAYPQLVAPFIEGRFITLGTDGFGRSDTRQALRQFFEVDRHHIVLAALDALASEGAIARTVLADAIKRYAIDPEALASWSC